MIQSIVEGDGEVGAFPILLQRLVLELSCQEAIGYTPFLEKRTQITKEDKFKRAVQIAGSKPNTSALIVLFDSDGVCAQDHIPQMLLWGREVAPQLPLAVVMAQHEYEARFLAAVESLRGVRRIEATASYELDPDKKQSPKSVIDHFMPRDKPYSPTADQPALSAQFHLGQAFQNSSSFRKLVKEIYRLLTELEHQPMIPTEWEARLIFGT